MKYQLTKKEKIKHYSKMVLVFVLFSFVYSFIITTIKQILNLNLGFLETIIIWGLFVGLPISIFKKKENDKINEKIDIERKNQMNFEPGDELKNSVNELLCSTISKYSLQEKYIEAIYEPERFNKNVFQYCESISDTSIHNLITNCVESAFYGACYATLLWKKDSSEFDGLTVWIALQKKIQFKNIKEEAESLIISELNTTDLDSIKAALNDYSKEVCPLIEKQRYVVKLCKLAMENAYRLGMSATINALNIELPNQQMIVDKVEFEKTEEVAEIPVVSDVEKEAEAENKPEKKSKVVYCKKCGEPIDSTTKKCTGCGKQYFNSKKSLPIIIMSVVIAILVGLNIFQFIYNGSVVEELEAKISTLEIIKSANEKKISDLDEKESDTFLEYVKTRKALKFYEENACIVPDDGKKTYHIYGCEYLGDETYWIYNSQLAQNRGYKPCPHCYN